MASRIFPILLLAWLVPHHGAMAQHGRGKGKSGHRPARPAQKPPAPPPQPATSPSAERKPGAEESGRNAEEQRDLRRGERVEFDGRIIEGQTAASGAIYLFERLPSELRSMVVERKNYRREILETLYPDGVPPARPRTGPARMRDQGSGEMSGA